MHFNEHILALAITNLSCLSVNVFCSEASPKTFSEIVTDLRFCSQLPLFSDGLPADW